LVVSPAIEEPLPKYVQIARYIHDQIVRGELKPGEEIPSERAIVEGWGVSRPTATRALAALRAEGLVDARQGSGTFVRAHPRLNRRALDRYARSRETGRVYVDGEWSEISAAERFELPAEAAGALGLEPGAGGIRRKRIVYQGSEPVETSVSWLDGALAGVAPRLLERERIREGTVGYVERVTGRRAQLGRDQIAARLATAEERADLKLRGNVSAVLVVRHLVVDSGGIAIEYVEATYPPDHWTFEQQYPISG
jgi:DNA-binding GntR family transcriptional regulator